VKLNKSILLRSVALPVVLLVIAPLTSAQQGYQKPPQSVMDILNAPSSPNVSIAPTRDRMLMAQGERYPSIAELAEPMLRLAGQRVNPNINGPHRSGRFSSTITALTLKNIADGKEIKLTLPVNAKLSLPQWSPDGKMFAVTGTTATAIELWIGDAATGKLTPIRGAQINAVYGDPVQRRRPP
jgi:hypothetical protein